MRIEDLDRANELGRMIKRLRSKRELFDDAIEPPVYPQKPWASVSVKGNNAHAWLDGEELPEQVLNDVMAVIYTYIATEEKRLTDELATL